MIENFSVITLVNNDDVYSKAVESLKHQGANDLFEFIPIYADKLGWNAAIGLNEGIRRATAKWVICVHQDVIFPDKWFDGFKLKISKLPQRTAVVGLVGTRMDGRYAGHIKDPHGHTLWKPLPASALSVDEHLIVIDKNSDIRFDAANPGFHVYGTDICLTAREKCYKTMIIDAPIIHLSPGRVDTSYDFAAKWLLSKWGAKYNYVIPTCAMIIYKKTSRNVLQHLLIRVKRRLSSILCRAVCDCERVIYTKRGNQDSGFERKEGRE